MRKFPAPIHVSLPARKFLGFAEKDSTPNTADLAGIRFENIRVAAPYAFGERDVLWGFTGLEVYDLTFDNYVVVGEQYDHIDDFEHNEYAYDMVFENTAPQTFHFVNNSGYGKWSQWSDWDIGTEPANHDIVRHASVADPLAVDASAYAGELLVSHPDKAVLSIFSGGHLTVSHGLPC